MAYQSTFQRYELKYMLTKEQKEKVLDAMSRYMKIDEYGRTTIRNIYFDTDNYRLIRHSLEKPVYKEKLRLRSYQKTLPQDPVFVELKKKYKNIVYKRRLVLPQAQVMEAFEKNIPLAESSQIAEEIDYFRAYYQNLAPAVFLSYEREAYYSVDGSDFRVTFDENILYREHDFSLGSDVYGTPLLAEGHSLMEIKTSGGYPLWMSHVLSEQRIYKTSFSKYGSAYKQILNRKQGGLCYA